MRKPLAPLTATLIAAVVCLAPSSVAAKGTLVRIEVGFDLGPWRPAYVVLYRMDRAASGYIYLPDHDDDFGEWNTTSIAHGVEGHWFHASRAWEQRVRPLVLARANEDEQAQH
jgi:hypothetical protein